MNRVLSIIGQVVPGENGEYKGTITLLMDHGSETKSTVGMAYQPALRAVEQAMRKISKAFRDDLGPDFTDKA